MLYYYLASFYKNFFKKRSSWELQAIFVVSITQAILFLDLWMLFTVKILKLNGSVDFLEKIFLAFVALLFLFLNMKRYEKKYLNLKEKWFNKKYRGLYIALTVFTVIFSWCFVFILIYI